MLLKVTHRTQGIVMWALAGGSPKAVLVAAVELVDCVVFLEGHTSKNSKPIVLEVHVKRTWGVLPPTVQAAPCPCYQLGVGCFSVSHVIIFPLFLGISI